MLPNPAKAAPQAESIMPHLKPKMLVVMLMGKQRNEPQPFGMTISRALGLPAVPVWREHFGLFTTRVVAEKDALANQEPGFDHFGLLTSADAPSR
jgi:hypothetical protein